MKIHWSFQLLGLERGPSKRALQRAAFLARYRPNPIARARQYEAALAGGTKSYRDVARDFGVTKAEVCQYIALIRRLPPDLLTKIECEERPEVLRAYSYRRLLAMARARRPAATDRRELTTAPCPALPRR
jgi:hypothetical protein